MATGQEGASALPWCCCWRLSCWCFRAVPRSSRRGRGKKESIPRCKRRPRRSSPCRMGRAQRGSLPRMGRMGRAYRRSPCRMGRPSGSNPPAHPKSRTQKSRTQKSRGSLLCSRIPRRSRSRPRRLSRPSRRSRLRRRLTSRCSLCKAARLLSNAARCSATWTS